MTEQNSNEEPKIVVDDDYKSRVEQEREKLRRELEESSTEGSADDIQMPPASLPVLITTLATQALSNMGQIPDPIEGKAVIRKSIAKHFIDTLAMLEEKTKGNLNEEEAEMLGSTVHQLRMVFVSVPDAMPEETPAKPESSLELPS